MNETSTCSNCRFWKPRDEQPGSGKCKYGPPIWVRPNRPGDFSAAAWPTTPANEFCFRHESYLTAKMSDFTRKPETVGVEVFVQGRDPVVEKVLAEQGFKPVVPEEPAMSVSSSSNEAAKTNIPRVDEVPSAPAAPTPEPAPAVPLATNQIAQLVRGKRQPGQRLE